MESDHFILDLTFRSIICFCPDVRMELINFAKQFVKLSPEMEAEINGAFKREAFPKNHKLLSIENFSKKVFYLEKGLARTFYLKDGKDITHNFFSEGAFFLPIESIFYNETSPYGFELLEDGIVRTINYPDLEKYFDKSKAIEKMGRLMMINAIKTFSDKLSSIQFQSAQERYQTMLGKFPGILLRAPLGNIASYLGITQETLSRIRAGK